MARARVAAAESGGNGGGDRGGVATRACGEKARSPACAACSSMATRSDGAGTPATALAQARLLRACGEKAGAPRRSASSKAACSRSWWRHTGEPQAWGGVCPRQEPCRLTGRCAEQSARRLSPSQPLDLFNQRQDLRLEKGAGLGVGPRERGELVRLERAEPALGLRRRGRGREEARVAGRLSRGAEGPHRVGDGLRREACEPPPPRLLRHLHEEVRHGRARPSGRPREVRERLRVELAQPAPLRLRLHRCKQGGRRAVATRLGQRPDGHRQVVRLQVGHPLHCPVCEPRPQCVPWRLAADAALGGADCCGCHGGRAEVGPSQLVESGVEQRLEPRRDLPLVRRRCASRTRAEPLPARSDLPLVEAGGMLVVDRYELLCALRVSQQAAQSAERDRRGSANAQARGGASAQRQDHHRQATCAGSRRGWDLVRSRGRRGGATPLP